MYCILNGRIVKKIHIITIDFVTTFHVEILYEYNLLTLKDKKLIMEGEGERGIHVKVIIRIFYK